jgi:hypothetical protein
LDTTFIIPPLIGSWEVEYREASFEKVPTHNPPGSHPLLPPVDSSNKSQHTSMDHASPFLDDSCNVFMDPSSQYDGGPLSTSTIILLNTPIAIWRQTRMVDVDPIDD